MKRILLLVALGFCPVTIQAADLKDLEKRMEALEYGSYENTVNVNGFFESRYDSYTRKVEGEDAEKINMNRWLLGLDFKAKPAPNVSFFGRITASTMYNPGAAETTSSAPTSLTGPRGYNDAIVRVERAFFNYEAVPGLNLTVGRLPTLDGPPNHLYDGLPRLGTYPKLIYAAVLDGYALTYNIPISSTQNLAIRYVDSPFSLVRPNFGGDGTITYKKGEVIDPVTGNKTKDHDLVDIAGGMLDYTATGTGIARKINIIAQYIAWKDFKFLSMKWDYSRYSIYAELEDIANLGINAYAGTLSTTNKTEGGLIVGADPSTGMPIRYGLMSDSADSTVKGNGRLIGVGYLVPVDALKNPLVGFETISSDRGYLIFDSTAKEPFEFYGIRGSANQVYLTFDLATGLKLRIGQVTAAPKYVSGLTIGQPAETKDKNSTLYANFRLDY